MSFLSEAIKSFTPKLFSICSLLNIEQSALGLRREVKERQRTAYIIHHTVLADERFSSYLRDKTLIFVILTFYKKNKKNLL